MEVSRTGCVYALNKFFPLILAQNGLDSSDPSRRGLLLCEGKMPKLTRMFHMRTAANLLGELLPLFPHEVHLHVPSKLGIFILKESDCATSLCLLNRKNLETNGKVLLNHCVHHALDFPLLFIRHLFVMRKIEPQPLGGDVLTALLHVIPKLRTHRLVEQVGRRMQSFGLLRVVGQSARKFLLRSGSGKILMLLKLRCKCLSIDTRTLFAHQLLRQLNPP